MPFLYEVNLPNSKPEAITANCYCDFPTVQEMQDANLGEGTLWECPECGRVVVYLKVSHASWAWTVEHKAPVKFQRRDPRPENVMDLSKVFFSSKSSE